MTDPTFTADHPLAPQLEAAILGLLALRAAGTTICPSEAARAVASEYGGDWRALMTATRLAAQRLAAAGRIDVTQRGRRIDPARARGPIRLRLRT